MTGTQVLGGLLHIVLLGCGGPRTETASPGGSDRDGDRILDRCDRCPDDAEPYNLFADDDGCPEDKVISESRHPTVRRVFFATGSAAPGPDQDNMVDFIAGELSQAGAEDVVCVGTASIREPDPIALSRSRAEWVCDALLDRRAASGASAHGLGASDASASPSDSEQRQAVTVIQLSARLREHWYAPLYVFGRWDGDHVEPVERVLDATPTGPPRCPAESSTSPEGQP